MYKFSYPGLEPVKVLKNVVLPYPEYRSEMLGDTRPVVFMYYYRINNIGIEASFRKDIGGPIVRYLRFDRDSDKITQYTSPCHYSSRSLLVRELKFLLNKSSRNHSHYLDNIIRKLNEAPYPESVPYPENERI
jgi:hypothetical protein